jgi:Xaa-Pro aminopeptidase
MQIFFLMCISLFSLCLRAESSYIDILSKLEQSKLQDRILSKRLDDLLPVLMRKSNIDCWVIISEEYSEDPVMKTLLPSTRISARQLSVIIFLDHGKGNGVERLLAARFEEKEFYKQIWNLNSKAKQWDAINEAIEDFNPKAIAFNYSNTLAHADGISKSNFQRIVNTLNSKLRKRIISAEALATDWLSKLIPVEIESYKKTLRLSREIVKSLLSDKDIELGVTTTTDLKWNLIQRVTDLGLQLWFQPFISIKRSDKEMEKYSNVNEEPKIVRAGDIIFIGLGISYLGYNSDTQENAYVLREDEKTAPNYLASALSNTVNLQNIIASKMKKELTGNNVLTLSRKHAEQQGVEASIYSHPIGIHGHGAGALVGLWEQQEKVGKSGELRISSHSAYAIEGTTYMSVSDWGKSKLAISLAHVAYFDGNSVEFIAPRQLGFHLVRPSKY